MAPRTMLVRLHTTQASGSQTSSNINLMKQVYNTEDIDRANSGRSFFRNKAYNACFAGLDTDVLVRAGKCTHDKAAIVV